MTGDLWAAPYAGSPVDAVVSLPGSKSITNRALVLAAISAGPSAVHRPLHSRDTALMVGALRALGTEVDDAGDAWYVRPHPFTGAAAVDCGLAGTVMRFVPPLAALAQGPVRLDGDPRARLRPMGPVVRSLRDLGVAVDDEGGDTLPFTVHGRGGVDGGEVRLDASASSQFVSGLLLAAARFTKGAVVRHVGAPVPSTPHIAMTVEMLRAAGVPVDDSRPDVWEVQPAVPPGGELPVEPDLSGAAPFLAAALVTGGRVTVPGWPARTTQAGDALRDLLTAMGAEFTLDADGLSVRGRGRVLGLDADLHDVGELTPVLAACAALADGPSRLRGVAHLRGHETDRLAALATELTRLGGDVTEEADGLSVRPRPLRAGIVHTYDDHRIAHAAAVLGLAVPGVQVEDVACTRKTMPDFVGLWAAMLGGAR